MVGSLLLISLVFCVVFMVGSLLLISLVFCVVFMVGSLLLISFVFCVVFMTENKRDEQQEPHHKHNTEN
jgi:heme/copper-type cytochrome/quinol oxidase subunit 2